MIKLNLKEYDNTVSYELKDNLIDFSPIACKISGRVITKERWEDIKEQMDDFYNSMTEDEFKEMNFEIARKSFDNFCKNKKDAKEENGELKKLDKKGYIYIITDDSGLYKIGKSKNVERRLSELNTANPKKLRVLEKYKTSNMDHYENKLHEYFKEYRMNGEWFELTEECLKLGLIKLEGGYFNEIRN